MKRPKHIRIYDNGGQTADRYTVVYMSAPSHVSPYRGTSYESYGLSADPFSPLGVAQHCPAIPGPHLGKRIGWDALPEDCKRAVIQDTNA